MTAIEPTQQREGLELVRELPIVQLMPDALRELVIESFEERSFGFGDYLVTEGEESDAFYVVTEGLVRVVTPGPDGSEMTVDMMRPGESFGERGLLEDVPRTRSVRASTPAAAAGVEARTDRVRGTSSSRPRSPKLSPGRIMSTVISAPSGPGVTTRTIPSVTT